MLDGIRAALVKEDSLRRSAIPADYADLIVTSPPYNVGKDYDGKEGDLLSRRQYMSFTEKWLKNCFLWSREGGRLCVNVSLDKNKNGKIPLASDVTQKAISVGWKYHATIIWNEGNISKGTAWGSWLSANAPHIIAPVEVVIVLYKGEWNRGNGANGRKDTEISSDDFKEWVRGVWTFNGESGKRVGHEAPFPRELPRRCIKLLSFKGDTVLDPFVGSGTTMIEALANDRRAIGIEKEERYITLTRKRVEKTCGVKFKPSPTTQRRGIYICV